MMKLLTPILPVSSLVTLHCVVYSCVYCSVRRQIGRLHKMRVVILFVSCAARLPSVSLSDVVSCFARRVFFFCSSLWHLRMARRVPTVTRTLTREWEMASHVIMFCDSCHSVFCPSSRPRMSIQKGFGTVQGIYIYIVAPLHLLVGTTYNGQRKVYQLFQN